MSDNNHPRHVTPTQEQTEQMASDMLNSAVSQKSQIAGSFENQRDELLRAIEAKKQQTINEVQDRSNAVNAASGAALEQAAPDIPPPTEEELAIIKQVLAIQEQQAKTSVAPKTNAPHEHGLAPPHENTELPPAALDPATLAKIIGAASMPQMGAQSEVMVSIALAIKDMIKAEVSRQLTEIQKSAD